ncbi:MAG: hypothetical protein ACYCS8_08585 [Acidithiobacillus sp.]
MPDSPHVLLDWLVQRLAAAEGLRPPWSLEPVPNWAWGSEVKAASRVVRQPGVMLAGAGAWAAARAAVQVWVVVALLVWEEVAAVLVDLAVPD